MANLVLGVAGAAIGFFVGGPVGAQYGFMLGSAVGSIAFAETAKSEGPRVGDAQITTSTLGTPMAVLYGTSRLAGNVIQASKVREVAKTESQGKGGPSAESTTYSYNADIAIDLCEGAAQGIRKIWTDGKLTYDISTDVDAASGIASTTGAAGFAFYPGDETQLPDPTLEAITGVGATPAYRGRCYVVFAQLNCPGGRIPQLTFEVLREGDPSFAITPYADYDGGSWAITKDAVMQVQMGVDNLSASVAKRGPGYTEYSRTFALPWPGNEMAGKSVLTPCVSADYFYAVQGQGQGDFVPQAQARLVDLETGAPSGTQSFSPAGGVFLDGGYNMGTTSAFDAETGHYVTMSAVNGEYARIWPANELLWTTDVCYALAVDKGHWYALLLGEGIITFDGLGARGPTIAPPAGTGVPVSMFVNPDTGYLYFMDNGAGVGNASMHRYDGISWVQLVEGFIAPATMPAPFYANEDYAIIGPAPTGQVMDDSFRLLMYHALAAVDPLVSDIITDQCARSGIAVDKLDFVGVADTVPGYPVTRVSSGRANIQPLQTAFFIDAAEVDLKLVFTKRASAPLAPLIPYDELAASEDGSTAGDPFPLVRAQEEEFPRSVTTSFIDINSDYQPGAESSRREVTKSINDVSSAIPICTTSDHAKQVAEVLLFDAWNGRNKRSGTLTRKYAYLTPGDVVPIEYPAGTVQQWILTRVSDTGLLIEFEAVEANASLYQVAPPGSTGSSGQIVAPEPGPTNLAVLDIPILREADNDAGLYVAMSAAAPSWRGATLYIGKDDTTLAADGAVSTSSPIGFAQNSLAPWSSYEVDECSTLVVSMGIHALSSTTRDAMLDSGVNGCVIGAPGRWEVCQFIRATSLGDGEYELSGFLRGLRGTEQHRGSHVQGDAFVLLVPAGMTRPSFDVAELNQSRQFRAVTNGRAVAASKSQDATNTGAGLKPLSPVNVRCSRQDDGAIRITWDRRTRFSSNWLAGVMPLGESSEAYEVDIVVAGGVKRTLSASTAQADYALADQYGDAGEAVTAITARVYQMSALVGRGFGSEFSSAVAPQAGGSTFPGSSSVTLAPVAAAGLALIATSVAKYGDNTAYKVFESYDQGVTFTQLDGLGAPVSNIPNASVSLADGTYISFEYEKLNDPAQTDFYLTRGAQGSAPAVTATKFSRPYAPLSMGTDGSKFVVITYGNRVYTSTDGIAFTLQGVATLPNTFVFGNGLGNGFVWAAGRWFIVPPGGRDLYYTTDVNAVTGWTACALPTASGSDYYFPQYYRMAERAGVLFISALRFHIDSNVSVILKSTDSGSTWTVALDPAVGSFSDVWNLSGRLVAVSYDFVGKSNISDDGGATWSAPSNGLSFVDRTYAVQFGNTLVVAAGRSFIAPGDAPQQLRYTTDGVTFTNSAGV